MVRFPRRGSRLLGLAEESPKPSTHPECGGDTPEHVGAERALEGAGARRLAQRVAAGENGAEPYPKG